MSYYFRCKTKTEKKYAKRVDKIFNLHKTEYICSEIVETGIQLNIKFNSIIHRFMYYESVIGNRMHVQMWLGFFCLNANNIFWENQFFRWSLSKLMWLTLNLNGLIKMSSPEREMCFESQQKGNVWIICNNNNLIRSLIRLLTYFHPGGIKRWQWQYQTQQQPAVAADRYFNNFHPKKKRKLFTNGTLFISLHLMNLIVIWNSKAKVLK